MTAVAVSFNWFDYAACHGSPISFITDDEVMIARAKQVCASCPVKAECLVAGQDEAYGVWGGLTPEERGVIPLIIDESCISCGGVLVQISPMHDKCLSCDCTWYR